MPYMCSYTDHLIIKAWPVFTLILPQQKRKNIDLTEM